MMLLKYISSNCHLILSAIVIGALVIVIVPVELLVGCILLAMALLLISLLYARNHRLALLLLGGLIIRAVLVYSDQIFGFLPDQPDQVMYNYQAKEILQSWSSGMYPIQAEELAKGFSPYSYLLAALYWPFGYLPLLGRLFNALISILAIYYFYHIILEILDERKIAWKASLLLAFLPSFIVFSSYTLRDTLLILLSLVMLFSIIKISKRQSVAGYSVLLLISIILNVLLRMQNLFLFAGFFIVFFIAKALASTINWKVKLAVVLFLAAVPVVYYHYQSESFISVATYFFRAQPLRVEGGSSYLVEMEYQNFTDVVRYLPIRFIYFCFGPFFWQAHGLVQWLTALEGLLFLILFIAAVLYFYRGKKNYSVWLQYLVFGFALSGLLANSIVDSNFGTAVRHKLDYIILVFPFALMYLRKYRIQF